jgi:uncharacterized repeat protein (TIGR01451 family)
MITRLFRSSLPGSLAAAGLALLAMLPRAEGATIASFSPASGAPGTQILVSGSSLLGTTNVMLGDVAADFSVLAHDRLLVVVPPLPMSGLMRLGTTAGSALSSASFIAPPRIAAFTPERSGTNTFVTINGANFLGATAVRFGGTNAATFTVTAPTQIQAKVPAGAPSGPIEVTAPGGVARSETGFTVSGPAPIVDGMEPAIGAPGSQVRIDGANFAGATRVTFNGAAAAYVVTAETQISATVPATAATGPVAVTTAKGTGTSTNAFTVTRAPVVTNFLPAIGVAGTSVTLEGINFTNVTGISFNGRPVPGFGTPAPGQLNVTVPSGATTGPIRVTNSFGVGVSAAPFVVTAAPLITEFSPEVAAPGAIVVINGANFTGTTAVSYAGRPAAFSVTAPTQLQTTVPSGATTGPLVIRNASGSCTSATPFVVIGSAPFVSEFTPERGPRGTTVILTGLNFTNVTAVSFNGTNASYFVATALSQIHAVVPPAATTGPIRVTTTSGSFATTNAFHVPPRIVAFVPASGYVGDTVSITGTNLGAALSVQIGGLPWDFSALDDRTLRSTVPTQAVDGLMTVATPGGDFITQGGFLLLPRLNSFSPSLGAPGTPVTLLGTGLSKAHTVLFGGVPAAFQVISSTELRAQVPQGGRSGRITVQTPNGSASLEAEFTVTGSSDLSLSTVVTPAIVGVGDAVMFHVTLMNQGQAIVSDVRFTNTLPAGLTLVSATVSSGTLATAGRVSTARWATLDPGALVSFNLAALAHAEGRYTNLAVVAGAEQDPVFGNNVSAGVVAVLGDASRLLKIQPIAGGKLVVTWPTSALDFVLQSTTNLRPSAAWSTAPGTPVITGGELRLTNTPAAIRQFYRLRN